MIRNATDPILKFNETVISIVDETIAKTSTNPKHQGKPWINDDCKDAITNRKNPTDSSENILHRIIPTISTSSERKLEEH